MATKKIGQDQLGFKVGQRIKFKPGTAVICNGFPGTVQGMYSEGMVDVRLASGPVCVAASFPDCYPSHGDSERQHAVIKFLRDVQYPRYSMKAGECWGFVMYGRMSDAVKAIKAGQDFEFAGGTCLAKDVELIYEGIADVAYSKAAGDI